MPFYVADYLADTAHLRAAESGGYLHLIMHYWQKGALPDDDRQLAAIARMTDREWKLARPTIASFFGPSWTHKRIEAELAKAAEVSERRSANAQKRWSKQDANVCQSVDATAHANASPNAYASDMHRAGVPQPQSQDSSTELSVRKNPPRSKPRTQIAEDAMPATADAQAAIKDGLSPDQFLAEWKKFRDWHRSKGNLMADWSAAWRTWLANRRQFSRDGPTTPRSKETFLTRLSLGIDANDQDHDASEIDPYDGSVSTPTIEGNWRRG